MEPCTYPSHFDPVSGRYQSNRDHLSGTAEKAQERGCSGLSPELLRLAALLHDCGKYSAEWAKYFASSIEGKYRDKKLDHATAGGIQAEKLLAGSLAAELVSTAIYSHHGLHDSYSFDNDEFLTDQRREKSEKLPVSECADVFFSQFGKDEIEKLAVSAKTCAASLSARIKKFVDKYKGPNGEQRFGDQHFMIGMYERLLTSILIDSDRRDTEDFMSGENADADFGDTGALWRECLESLEKKLSEMDMDGEINACRREISELCRKAADSDANRFILSVPTGAGKTLSSLRFALTCAQKRNKKRIIYVAPYMSITEQNAKEIRDAIGRDDIVLEHHSTIVTENDDETARYYRLTEDWRVPVVVTTAVQFLNTLFSSATSSVRRLGSLCDSVVIIDEVQALPIKVTELFCAAVNFWSEFEGAVFVLCSATQPCFEKLTRNCLLPASPMVAAEQFSRAFVRTELHDDTDYVMDVDAAAEYIADKARMHGDVLFIANTKSCAANVYSRVCEICGGEFDVSHLSTNLYPEHRRSIIKKLRKSTGRPRICISTQVVEAGVNLSFRCVIRSLAGLDSVIQAAGRCNRNGEYDIGHVYIVRPDSETEKLSRLPDIRSARETMTYVLDQYHRYGKDGERLDDKRYIDMYYSEYYDKRRGELSYNVNVGGVSTSIVKMLSSNSDLCPKRKGHALCQAFDSAGSAFEVIEEDGKFSVVVETNESSPLILEYERADTEIKRKKQILRRLASYTVAISDSVKKEIGSGIRQTADGSICVLDKRYYNDRTGVTVVPSLMEDQIV